MTSFVLTALLFFVLGIALNALFSGYEIGFISADRIRMRYLAEEEKDVRAALLLAEMHRPEKMLTTVLIGTNAALIAGTFALTSLVTDEWLSTLIAAPAFLVFGEIVPKSVFRRHPNVLSLRLLPVMRVFELLLAPLVWPTLYVLRGLRWVTGRKTESLAPVLSTEEDLRHLIDESAARGSIERDEQEMIHSVMDLADIHANEIMVPRIDIEAVPSDATRDDLIRLFQKSGRTRIPIYDGSIDKILGVATAFDVLLDARPEDPAIARYARPVLHVPDSKPLDELLQALKADPLHIAIVTDEYGGTDGLVALEDVLEEIFGEIHDEYDREESLVHRLGPASYLVDARMPLADLSAFVGVPIQDEEVETFGGWIARRAGRIPLQGEKIKHGPLRVTVLEGRQNHIGKVRLDVLEEAPGAPVEAGD
jgi:CBS domain containing-hemolysin-like protein